MLASSKLKQAMIKLGHEKKINLTEKCDDDFADAQDLTIRILMAPLRDMKKICRISSKSDEKNKAHWKKKRLRRCLQL